MKLTFGDWCLVDYLQSRELSLVMKGEILQQQK